MNLIILTQDDLTASGGAIVTGRRARHIREVHRATPGQVLKLGLLGGSRGTGVVASIGQDHVAFEGVALDQPPPPPTGLDFILAIPRPKVLTRVLEAASSLGARRIVLMNCVRVEKSYFDSPRLDSEAVRDALVRGLEQGSDTVLPEIVLAPRFRPFVEDQVPELFPRHRRLLAHPGTKDTIHEALRRGECADAASSRFAAALPTVVAIGPEGGFVPFEVQLLEASGFAPFHLGDRILRVETALPFIAGQYAAALSATAFPVQDIQDASSP